MPRQVSPTMIQRKAKASARGSTLSSMPAESLSPERMERVDVPVGWRIHLLRELVLQTEQTDPRVQPDREFQYVDVSAVSHDTLSIVEASTIRGVDAPSRARKLIKAGDVIFATVRPSLKRVAIVPPNLDGQVCSTAFCVIRADPALADAGFLFFTTAYDVFVKRVSEHQRGSSYPAITNAHVLGQWIPLPPLPEQRAIAEVLRRVQRAKEAIEKVIAATRQLKASLMKHLFTYGPVPFAQADHVPPEETDVGPIPENWQVTCLEGIKAPQKGAIVSGPFGSNIGKRFFVPSGVPLIRGCNLTTGQALFVEEGFVFITEEKALELANCTALPDDLVFTAAGTIGQVGLIPQKCRYPKYVISNKQLRARVDKSKASPLFLFYWFTQPRMQAYVQARKSGTSIPVINLSVLRALPIGLPSMSEQRQIAEQLSAVDANLAAKEQRRHALDVLFKSLLHHLMTGKVRVKDIEVHHEA